MGCSGKEHSPLPRTLTPPRSGAAFGRIRGRLSEKCQKRGTGSAGNDGGTTLRENLFILIMAGGKGERFWPRSRTALPKQFLRLCNSGTLLQETFRRARRLVPAERIYVATPARYRDLTSQQLPALPAANLILEPFARDTAPCIGLAAISLEKVDPEATMVVLPADHVIAGEDRFLSALEAAGRVAAEGTHLLTLGITPTRPETGYGYIHCGDPLTEVSGWPVRAVNRFLEKPAHEEAVALVASGEYLWNSGMFAWKVSTLRALIAAHLPWLHEGLERIAPALGTPRQETAIREAFSAFRSLSIDYGLMERAENVAVIPGDFGWDDVGSWAALERVREKDERGNVSEGRVVAIDTTDCILFNPGGAAAGGDRLLVTYGVHGLVVVDTPDVLLVADKTQSAHLKQVAEELRRRGLERYLDGEAARAADPPGTGALEAAGLRVIEKPWGQEIWWAATDRYVGKIIEVRAGHALSLQYHRVKLETMLFTRGSGTFHLGSRRIAIREGLCVTIPPGTLHRVEAETDVQIYEVSTPETEDVVRLADDYGRATFAAEA